MTDIWRHRLFVAAPFAAVGLLALFAPSDDGPTICPFALCTGSACPGCGMTRAASSLVRGNVGAAISYHPLVFLVALQALSGWTWYLLRRRDLVRPMSQRTLTLFLAVTTVAFVTVWLIRFLNGTLPSV